MAKDIVPNLLDKITDDFLAGVRTSDKVKQIEALIEAGTATHAQALDYATELGEILESVFKRHLKSSVLPDGRMYFNISSRIMNSTLTRDHHMVADVTAQIQQLMNREAGIGIKALKPPVNQSRIDGLIERLSSEEVFDDVAWIVEKPIVNFSQSVVDAAVKVNADFHAAAGLQPTITRSLVSETCDWCSNLAGTYPYAEVKATGHPVFMRHKNCDCLVEYNPGDGSKRRQNVHSKKWR